MKHAPVLLREMDWREARWVALGAATFAVVFAYPMLCPLGYLGPGLWGWINRAPDFSHLARFPANGDWDLFAELRWVPYHAVTHFHQAPFWNPYKCGGMAMLGNPESGIVTPFFILYLLFGPYAGLYLEIFLHLAIAFAGGYVLARAMELNRIAAVVCGAAFPASSWLYLHLSVGHLNFLPAAYLPWVAALLIVAINRRSRFIASIGGLVCALTFTEGNYTFLYAGIIVAIIAVKSSASQRSVRPLAMGLLLGCFAGAFAALKLLPAWELLTVHPRAPFGPEYDDFKMMLTYLFSRNQDLYRTGASVFLFAEYGAYLSPAFAILALLAIVGRTVKAIPWISGAIIFFLLAQGDSGPHSLLVMLRHLPMTHQIDLPARFIIGFSFCAAVLAAIGADFVSRREARRWMIATTVLLIVGLMDSWMVGPPNLRYLFHNPIEPLPRAAEFHQIYLTNPEDQTEIAQANMGSVNCQGYGYNSIPTSALGRNQKGYRGEYYLRGEGYVVQTRWSPNVLSYEIDAPAATTLIVNQNYYPGWRIVEGEGALATEGTLIAVKVPAGHHRIMLRYRPRYLVMAVLLTLMAAAGSFFLWRREAKA
jgi:hypothetical protein